MMAVVPYSEPALSENGGESRRTRLPTTGRRLVCQRSDLTKIRSYPVFFPPSPSLCLQAPKHPNPPAESFTYIQNILHTMAHDVRGMFAILLLLFCQIASYLCVPTKGPQFAKTQLNTLYARQAPDSTLDPEDFSTIRSIAAIGDSYSSGIGSGSRIDWSCSRYDHSYPSLVFMDERLENATTQYLSCSGATSPEILEKQVPVLTGGIDAV